MLKEKMLKEKMLKEKMLKEKMLKEKMLKEKMLKEKEKLNHDNEYKEYNNQNSIDYLKKTKEIINKRGIRYLVHFTRVENLGSILKNGIIPVNRQSELKIISLNNDPTRSDSKLECTSFSVEFPNYALFYKFREYKYSGTRWVVLGVNIDILFSRINTAYFNITNAASSISRANHNNEKRTADAFNNMFCDEFNIKDKRNVKRRDLNIGENLTTDPQAEILISEIIDKKYIDWISFQDKQDMERYIQKNGSFLIDKYNRNIRQELFKPRIDNMFWKKEH
jgi:uncharacterized protein (DUF1330 family)